MSPKLDVGDLFAAEPDMTPVVEDVSMDGPLLTAPPYPCARRDLRCGQCGALMALRKSPKFPKPFYGCTRFPDCRGAHGAHPDGRPLGIPADKATNAARIRAHRIFDAVWKTQKMSRNKAYAWLRRKMHLTKEEAHIAKFTREQCDQLIRLVNEQWSEARSIWDHIQIEEDPYGDPMEWLDA